MTDSIVKAIFTTEVFENSKL